MSKSLFYVCRLKASCNTNNTYLLEFSKICVDQWKIFNKITYVKTARSLHTRYFKGLVQSDRGGSISLFLVISLGQKALT